ncbi:MAG: hypothetical protein QXS81_04275 [Candidatus Micrarchaeaceae archaeon]
MMQKVEIENVRLSSILNKEIKLLSAKRENGSYLLQLEANGKAVTIPLRGTLLLQFEAWLNYAREHKLKALPTKAVFYRPNNSKVIFAKIATLNIDISKRWY